MDAVCAYAVDVPSSPLASSPSSSVYKTAHIDVRKTGSVGSRPSNSQSNDDLTESDNSDDDNFYDAEEETRYVVQRNYLPESWILRNCSNLDLPISTCIICIISLFHCFDTVGWVI